MKIPYRFHSCKAFGLAAAVLAIALWASPKTLYGGSAPVILALGDSLTAGFGLSEEASYPSRLQLRLEQEGYPHRVINAGVSGDTTAGGLRRINWLLKHQPRIVILELGANDGLRGFPPKEVYANLEKIILICQEQNIQVLLTGMKAPPNYGQHYSIEFENVFHRLAEKHQLPFMPFFLEGVAGVRKYTQPDGLHPVAAGYEVVERELWPYLKPLLKKS